MKIHTKSRDNLYEATAEYLEGIVVVKKGSRINISPSNKYNPSSTVSRMRKDLELVNPEGILLKDVSFKSLSTAATFVTGRIANGMIVWKTEDNKYIKYSIQNLKD